MNEKYEKSQEKEIPPPPAYETIIALDRLYQDPPPYPTV